MFESVKIIGGRQADFAAGLMNSSATTLSGPVDYIHIYIDMSNATVAVNGTTATTCPSSMGYSFAAGVCPKYDIASLYMVSFYCFVTKACGRRPGAAASVERERRTLLTGAAS
jgi:hypothetical protein